MSVIARIDAVEIPLDEVWLPEMSLSSSMSEGRVATYSICLDKSDLLCAILPVYESCIIELKRDDELTGTSDAFGDAGYPRLDVLLENPLLLAEVLDTHFFMELFTAILPGCKIRSGTYALRGIASVCISGDRVLIEGPCFTFDSAVSSPNISLKRTNQSLRD